MNELKTIHRLYNSLNLVLDQLCDIRYKEWPTIGLGIDLNPETLDELIRKAELAIQYAKRNKLQPK